MANKKRNTKIHGIEVTQVDFSGNWYTTVDGRIKIAQQVSPKEIRTVDGGFHVVSHSILLVADRWAFTCTVEYPVGSGVHTCGSDFIDVKDATGLAKAETSAIGRALSMHGIDIEGGIASAEEMERVESPAATEQSRIPAVQEIKATIAPSDYDPAELERIAWEKLKERARIVGVSAQKFAQARADGFSFAQMAKRVSDLEQQQRAEEEAMVAEAEEGPGEPLADGEPVDLHLEVEPVVLTRAERAKIRLALAPLQMSVEDQDAWIERQQARNSDELLRAAFAWVKGQPHNLQAAAAGESGKGRH